MPGSQAVQVLGIDVDDATVDRWGTYLAPDRQPFFGEGDGSIDELNLEQVDTYTSWKFGREVPVRWLSEDEFAALPRAERARLVRAQARLGRGAVPTVRGWSDLVDRSITRAQADGHRFVWWPSLVTGNADAVLQRFLSAGELPSRHLEVPERVWASCQALVPDARRLAGTFHVRSGPNCFGHVMAAAGVVGADDESMECEPFEAWLAAACRPGGRTDDPGTVLVWRRPGGTVFHAAVTLGEGWAFEKGSQDWASPRVVRTVAEVKRLSRCAGHRLERHTLVD